MLGERLERTDPNSGIQLFSLPLSRVDNLISKLNIENKSSFFPGVGRNSYETAIEIPVLREAAPAIKDQISFLFVGKLQRPFFGTYKDALGILGTPNMGGGRNLEVWLHFRLDEIIVFNRRSGEIVKRINSQSK